MRLARFQFRTPMTSDARLPWWDRSVPPPRFRVRMLMLAVAITAIVMVLTERRWRALDLARQNGTRAGEAERAQQYSLVRLREAQVQITGAERSIHSLERAIERAEQPGSKIVFPGGARALSQQLWDLAQYEQTAESTKAELRRLSVQERHYKQLSAKYERAARYPWLTVPPDPPPPE